MTYIEKIIDITTGDETIRPYTTDEIAIVEAAKATIEAEAAQKQNAEAAKESARQAVLAKLGLTAEEAAALLA